MVKLWFAEKWRLDYPARKNNLKSLYITEKLNKAQTTTLKRKSYHPFHSRCKDGYFNKGEFAWGYTWPVGDYTINKFLVLLNSSWSIFLTWTSSKIFLTWQNISHGFHFEDEGQPQRVENGRGKFYFRFGSDISGFPCCFTVFSAPVTFPLSYGHILMERQSKMQVISALTEQALEEPVDPLWTFFIGTKERTGFSLISLDLYKFLIHCLLDFSLWCKRHFYQTLKP